MRLSLIAWMFACGGPTPEVAGPSEVPAPSEAPAPTEPPPVPAAPTELTKVVVPTSAGELTVWPVMHATSVIEAGGMVIWLDPWSKGDLTKHPKADVILITDLHPDHLDSAAIAAVSKEGTRIVAPKAVADQLGTPIASVLANGESFDLGGVVVRAVPMYNNVRGPEGGGVFHEKGRGNGYVLEFGGKHVYFAGDTECIDEMRALTNIDVAFLPMNLPYTMTPEEAAGCVKSFEPGAAVPYHYRDSDRSLFAAALDGAGTEVWMVDYYPVPAEQ